MTSTVNQFVKSFSIWGIKMQYNGGKHSCAKDIANLIGKCEVYWEPFVGAANVIRHVDAVVRIGSDTEKCMIRLLNAVKHGVKFPMAISEEEYCTEKQRDPTTAYHAFVKYGCSFGGKPWGGYARSGTRNYAANASNSLKKLRPNISDVSFICGDYRRINIQPDVVYCDPPYEGTTSVGSSIRFNSEEFWKWAESFTCDKMYVSEIKCPKNGKWNCIYEKQLKDGLGKTKITERLFQRI